jgi:hypothetical protein
MYFLGLVMALLALPIAASAQNWFGNQRITASRQTVTKDVRLRSFSAISIIGCGDIDLTVAPAGSAPQAKLIVPDNLQDIVQVYVKDDVLTFRLKQGYSVTMNNTTLKLQLTAPMVKSVNIKGSGDLDILNDAVVDHDVELSIAGSGDMDTHALTCNRLSVSIAGSGDVELGTVNAKSVSLSIAGSGDIEAKSVNSREVEASISRSRHRPLPDSRQRRPEGTQPEGPRGGSQCGRLGRPHLLRHREPFGPDHRFGLHQV